MLRPHLSYANVMATIAVFIALGGSAYAASKINGSTIRDRSIPASKIKKGSLGPTEVREAALADRTKQLVVSKAKKSNKTKTRDAATTETASATDASLIKLSIGQSAVLLQSGPFTYTVRCTADTDGTPLVSILASTTEAGTRIDFGLSSPETSAGNRPRFRPA